MTAIKNGIKCILRTPGKTLLFLLILTVTAALLTVSCCVFGAVRGYLNDCKDYFHTIADLEYIGRDYPDQSVYDESFAEAVEENRVLLESLAASDQVIAWEPASSEVMYTPQIHRFDTDIPSPDETVIRVKLHSFNDHLLSYNAIVVETLYSRKDYTNRMIMLRTSDSTKSLDIGGTYLLSGRFFAGRLQNPSVRQEIVSYYDGGRLVELPAALAEGAGAEEEAPFYRYAEMLHLKNDACRVTYTAAIEDLYPFHQQVLTLTKGRFFTQEEYDSKAHVVIVSEKVTGRLDLKVGDSISFSVFRSSGELFDDSAHTLVDEGAFEIVGITSHSETYPYWVFLPDSEVGGAICPVNGYTLGQFRLKNDGVSAFVENAAPLLDKGFRLNVYDQGYSAATVPMEELLFISTIFLFVCLLLAICALALQSHLFISRQSDAARTMHALGSGKLHVCIYFICSALALSIPSALLGAFIGKQAEGRVFEMLQRFASQFGEQDLRFSATRLAITRTLEFNPTSSLGAYLIAAGILAGGTLLFTLFFTLGSLRDRKTAKKKKVKQRSPKHPAKVSRLSGSFKYGLLSLIRGRGRSVAVLLLGVTAALFFGRLTASLDGYKDQLTAYKNDAVISGNATDNFGKLINGLVLRGSSTAKMSSSELLENWCATVDLGHIKFLGVEGGEQIPYYWPEYGSFAYESAFYWMSKGPLWIGTSSVSNSPLFHYSESGSVDWLNGWSEADFIRLDDQSATLYNYAYDYEYTASYRGGPAICALPNSMMEEYGIKLGDRINTVISYYHPDWYEMLLPMQLLVVASYVGPVGSTTVFSPITFIRPELEDKKYFPVLREEDKELPYWISGKPWDREVLTECMAKGITPAQNYSSFTYTLTDSYRLDDLRNELADAGFTWVRSGERNKNYALIDDEVYLNTVHSMERQIQYVSVLYDALYLLAGVIGFALAWLLIHSRRREIAVMRALGTQPGRIVGNFLLEQFLLIVIGLGIGVAVCRLTGASINRTQLILTAAFLGLWTVSSLICLVTGLRKKSFAALTEPE